MGKFDRAGEITEQLNRRRTHKAAKLTDGPDVRGS